MFLEKFSVNKSNFQRKLYSTTYERANKEYIRTGKTLIDITTSSFKQSGFFQ